MASKYDALREYLDSLDEGPQAVPMSTIDRLVGGLPASARTHRPFWANGTQSQARGWLDAGRKVESVDPNSGIVRFSARRSRG